MSPEGVSLLGGAVRGLNRLTPLSFDILNPIDGMKLQHFEIGERFEYDGKVFVKTGPMTASSEDGGQAMIPRYAVLKPLGTPKAMMNAEAPSRLLDERVVREAFDTYHRVCLRLCGEESRLALEVAKKRFLATIG